MTMTWKRERTGVYTAGPYRVEQIGRCWHASGPDVDIIVSRKELAQVACTRAAGKRSGDAGFLCEPVKGDIVLLTAQGRRGQVGAIMRGNGDRPLYSIHFTRSKRLCVFREEFQVIVP